MERIDVQIIPDMQQRKFKRRSYSYLLILYPLHLSAWYVNSSDHPVKLLVTRVCANTQQGKPEDSQTQEERVMILKQILAAFYSKTAEPLTLQNSVGWLAAH